jgi:hypothetical protein
MKLLLEGLLVALVLMCELVSLVALGSEMHPPAQERFTIIRSDDGGGEAYWCVEWEGSSSCSVVWEVQRAGDIVEVNSSSESEGDTIGQAKEDCRGVHIRPHLATSRQPGVRFTGRHRAQPTSENSNSTHFGE